MRLTTIGTGTVSPHPTRVSSAHLVEAGGARVLLDCGGGAVHRMASLGVRWQDITHVVLTHFHADHWSDLAPLIFAWRYGDLPPRSLPAEVLGPVGTRAKLEALAGAFGDWVLAPGFPLLVREIVPGDPVELAPGVRLDCRPVPHTDESVAYSIEHEGRRLVYTGDTGFDPTLGHWARGCDVLLAECSLPAEMALPSHLTPEECGALAAIAEPAHLVLTHFYPPVERVDVAALVRERFGGRTTLAVDGWTTDF